MRKLNYLTLLTFFLLSLYFIRVFPSPASSDTYWHMAQGRQIWQEKQIPQQDKFVYGVADTHFTSTEWLFGLFSYGLVKTFGFNSLLILRIILAGLTLYFLYLTLKLIYQDNLALNTAIALIGFVLALRLNDRPEMFSFAILSAVNYVCIYYFQKHKLSKLTYLIPFIFLIWPNLHPYPIFGIAILSFWFAILTLEQIRYAQNRQNIGTFTLIVTSSLIFSALQSKKTLYFLEVRRLLEFQVSEALSLWQRLSEIEFDFFKQVPIEIYIYLAILGLYTLLLIIFLSYAISSKRDKPSSIFFVLFYFFALLLPLKFYRLIPISLSLSAPAFWFLAKSRLSTSSIPTLHQILKASYFILVVIITASIYTKNIVGSKMYQILTFDEQGKVIGVKNRNWAPRFPSQSLEIIKSNLETKRLFTAPLWNSYFIWFLPQAKVMSDVMIEYQTRESFLHEAEIAFGGPNWENLLVKYQIDTIINTQPDSGQIVKTPVHSLGDWKLIFIDNISAVWAKNHVIRSQPLDLSAIEPQLPTILKFKPENETAAIAQLNKLLEYDPKNGFARTQLIIYYLDVKTDLSTAKLLAQESRTLIPQDPWYSYFLTVVYVNLNKCDLAKSFAQETKYKSFNDYNIRELTDRVMAKC